MKVKFTKVKETKGTWQYGEVGDSSTHKVGSLYVKKATVTELGSPEEIEITLSAVKKK